GISCSASRYCADRLAPNLEPVTKSGRRFPAPGALIFAVGARPGRQTRNNPTPRPRNRPKARGGPIARGLSPTTTRIAPGRGSGHFRHAELRVVVGMRRARSPRRALPGAQHGRSSMREDLRAPRPLSLLVGPAWWWAPACWLALARARLLEPIPSWRSSHVAT